jgi:hypothetical protein
LANFVAAGLSPYEALKVATLDAADFMGASGKFGVVRPGARADLVLIEGDPFRDVRNASRIVGVMVRGHWLCATNRPSLDLQSRMARTSQRNMRRLSKSDFLSVLIITAVAGCLCYRGTFYQTGAQFYSSCWQRMHANGREANSPRQAAEWATCDETAKTAVYRHGFVFAGNPDYAVTPQLKAVRAACPSSYGDVPVTGIWALAIRMIQDSGGTTLTDKFLPARATIVRVFTAKWPNCAMTATANGFPKLVKRKGTWEFDTECTPCMAEEQAMKKDNEDTARTLREWDKISPADRDKKVNEFIESAPSK